MSRCQWHYDHSPTPALHFRGTDDGVFRVVAALDDYIRAQDSDQGERRVFRKDYNEIYTLETGQHVTALRISAHWPRRSFEPSHRFIAVDADDQPISGLTRSGEDIDVAGMEKVKDTVGECDLALLCCAPALGFNPSRDFAGWVAWLQSRLAAIGWKWSTCSFLNGSLITSS